MTELNEALKGTIEWIVQKVYEIDPHGYSSEKWKLFEGENDIRTSAPSNRLFSVEISDEESELISVGSNCQDYNIIIDITICYESHKTQMLNAKRDNAKLVDKFINADKGTLFSEYGLHYFVMDVESYDKDEETKYMYMTVPVKARFTVTN